MREYCVLKKNDELRKLQSLIKLYSECNNTDSLQELNIHHVLNNTASEDHKKLIKEYWYNIEQKLNYNIFALCNLLPNNKGSLPKGYSFIIKLQSETAKDIAESMSKSTGIELEVLNVEIK